jgi:hypothetical protein
MTFVLVSSVPAVTLSNWYGRPHGCGVVVKEMYSYTTPAVLVIPVESIDPDYAARIEVETEQADVALTVPSWGNNDFSTSWCRRSRP